jgi:flagellar basal-body rod protein FlgC
MAPYSAGLRLKAGLILSLMGGITQAAAQLPLKSQATNQDALKNSQTIIRKALNANNIRMRVAAENMANSSSAGYVPKVVEMRVMQKSNQPSNVEVKQIRRDPNKVHKVYDPHHPQADADGMVLMPKVDPLMMMMDVNKARLDNERMMKTYQMASDMRHRIIKMMNH